MSDLDFTIPASIVVTDDVYPNAEIRVGNTIANSSAIRVREVWANGTNGNPNEILTSDGTYTYWAPPTAVFGVNTYDRYTWVNNHTFTMDVYFGNSTVNSIINSTTYSGTANNASYLQGNTVSDIRLYVDNKAANAYSNAITYSGNAVQAYTNAIAYSGNAAQAYTNAASYADTKAATAYANAIAYSGNAVQAYTNAVAYANSTFLKLSGGTLTGNLVLNNVGVSSNGTYGSSGQVLTTNGTSTYWSTLPASNPGTVTSVSAGSGLNGGTISSSGTLSINAQTGLISNTSGLYVNSAYIATLAPTLTGSGASGTWGISITGSATNWGTYGGVPAPGTSFGNASTIGRSDASGYTYFGYINSSTSNSENPTVSQVIVTNGSDNFYRKASISHLTSAVQSSASGTWGISISGGLTGTAPNLGYAVSGQNIDYSGQGGPQILGQGSGASMISFHRPGSYAINFGLGTDNQLRTGGWSRGGNYVILDSGNYSSYALPLSGGTMSGVIYGGSGVSSLVIGQYGGATRGYLYNDTSGFGLLTSGGGWALRVDQGTANIYIPGSLGVGTTASGTGGEIRATNEITAFYSDVRLKTDIEKISNASQKLKSINGILYKNNELAKSFGFTKEDRQVGVFAQDVLSVLPEAVRHAPFDIAQDGSSKSGENYLTVKYELLVPLLIEALKEALERIEKLENK